MLAMAGLDPARTKRYVRLLSDMAANESLNRPSIHATDMADNDDDTEAEPAVTLGDGPSVPGAPLSRLAARLTWPMEKSAVRDRIGDEPVRTAEGPVALASVLDEVDDTYFGSRQHFESAVRDQLPTGPVATE